MPPTTMNAFFSGLRCACPGLLMSLLSGCAIMPGWSGRAVDVTAFNATACTPTDGPVAVMAFADRAALLAYAQAHALMLPPSATDDGAYALVIPSRREQSVRGLAISREALAKGDTLFLTASFFPLPESRAACALVALPSDRFRHVVLEDPAGNRRAQADVPAAPLPGVS